MHLALALLAAATALSPIDAEIDTLPPTPSRSVTARLGRTVGNFAGDTWVVVSSPARITKRGAVGLAVVLAVGGALYANDEDLLEASLRNREDPTWKVIQDVGSFVEPVGFMGNTNPYYFGAAALGYVLDVRPLREIPTQILESHFIAGGVRNACKLFLGRRRPFENKGPYFFEFNGGTSFPSGHTSVLFEVATILSHHADWKPATVVLYGLATCGALERVHSRAHWPSDLVLSAVSGTLIARTVVQRNEARAAKLEMGVTFGAEGEPMLVVRAPLGVAR